MKAFLGTRRWIALVALLLAIVMCFSACGDKGKESSDADVSASYTTDASGGEETPSATDNGDSSQDTSNNNGTTNNNGGTTTNSGGTTPTGKTTWDADYLSTMPKSVKDKGVTLLMWRYLLPTEKKLIQDFEKKTGCKVTVIETPEPEYSTKLISLIAAKNAPDVINLGSDAFPSRVAKAMVPLDATVFRLDDKCWDKQHMDNFKVNGKYYSVAMEKSWNCTDTHYVTFYLPSVLKACGVTEMPYDLWKQGKWNWATQRDIAMKVANANRGYDGISVQSPDLLMLASGNDFVKYDGVNKFTSMVTSSTNSMLMQSWQQIAKLNEDGLVTGWNLINVKQGKIGLFSTISYGMFVESDWDFKSLPGGAESVNAVPVAAKEQSNAYVPYRPKTWGISKGCKNAEGAAYFLRYFLDYKNTNWESSFLNKQCKEVFEYITKSGVKKQPRVGYGVIDFVQANSYDGMINALSNAFSANVVSVMNAKKGTIDTAIKRTNKEVANIKG